MEQVTREIATFLASVEKCDVIWVAFSGGMDSYVLLHALASQIKAYPEIELKAIHVNHGLSTHAASWEAYCQVSCATLQVPLEIVRVQAQPLPGESPEAAARTARYRALQTFIHHHHILVTGQHARDQAETVFLQLFRGAGPKGLSAMPAVTPFSRGQLARPLLSCAHGSIKRYASHYQLQWIEDESNEDRRFARNFIRHDILPLLQKRWPALCETIGRSAQNCAHTQQVLQTYLREDLQSILGNTREQLCISKLLALSRERHAMLLREWLRLCRVKMPSYRKLHCIIDEVCLAAPDASPIVSWDEVEVRRYQDTLYLLSKPRVEPSIRRRFSGTIRCALPEIHGAINPVSARGQGIKKSLFADDAVIVGYRRGGERIVLNGHTRQLKKLFQTWGVPPWMRSHIPLLFHQDELICVVGYAVADHARASGEEAGISLQLLEE